MSTLNTPNTPNTPNLGGRPPKLTPDVRQRILLALRAGAPRPAAAALAGIPARTFRSWMARDDDAEPFASFRAEVLRAEGGAETRLVLCVLKAASKDPKAAMWLLERRFLWKGPGPRVFEGLVPRDFSHGELAFDDEFDEFDDEFDDGEG